MRRIVFAAYSYRATFAAFLLSNHVNIIAEEMGGALLAGVAAMRISPDCTVTCK
jgi:hypothetical protein